VAIYDTQQSGPIALLTKLHYDEFTDMTWSPDGQCLILSSRDGYCTLVIFDDILPAYHTQQHSLQVQSIAHNHSVPLTYGHAPSTTSTPVATPSGSHAALPNLITPVRSTKKRPGPGTEPAPPLTPAPSMGARSVSGSDIDADVTIVVEPPKKKRRVALTRVSDLES